jgi:hypothetical protein
MKLSNLRQAQKMVPNILKTTHLAEGLDQKLISTSVLLYRLYML